ncbi:hypothetical protein J6590_000571 [Homalodisca vitripennis]|nr:hypothetical protein J6590_000571 [Homalodisca vitripennis]
MPDSCLQLPSLRFPPSTFEEGVQGIVRIRIPVLAFRTRDLPHSVKVEAETTVPSEKLGKVEVYLSMLSFVPSPQITYEPKRPTSSTLRLPSSLPLIHCVRTGSSTADSAIPIVYTLPLKSKKIDGNYPRNYKDGRLRNELLSSAPPRPSSCNASPNTTQTTHPPPTNTNNTQKQKTHHTNQHHTKPKPKQQPPTNPTTHKTTNTQPPQPPPTPTPNKHHPPHNPNPPNIAVLSS